MAADRPTPTELQEMRLAYRLTKTAAARLVGRKREAWARYESGVVRMQPAMWSAFLENVSELPKMPAPSAAEVRQARLEAGLSLKKASLLIGLKSIGWLQYELGRNRIPTWRWIKFQKIQAELRRRSVQSS